MAFVANDLTDDEEKQNNPSQGQVSPQGGGGVRLAPSPGLVSGSGGGGGGSGKSSTPGAGGQFASLGQYVDANTPKAEDLTNQVLAPINAQADQSRKDVAQTLTDTQNQIKAGYTPQNQGLLDQANQDIVSFANDPNNVKSFQAQSNDKYTGPTSAESTAGYQKTFSDLTGKFASLKPLTQTTAGQETLLKNIETHPSNVGGTALNEAILSKNPDYLSKVTGAAQPFQDLLGTLSSGAAGINPSITAGQKESAAASKAANDLIASKVSGLSGIPDAASAAEAGRNDFNATVSKNNAQLTPINQAVKSFMESSGQTIDNPFEKLVNQSVVQDPITAANFATKDQYALAKALGTLSPDVALPLDQANASEAATAPTIERANAYDLNPLVNRTATDATSAIQKSDPSLFGGLFGTLNPNPTPNQVSDVLARASSEIGQPGYAIPGADQLNSYQSLLAYLNSVNPKSVVSSPYGKSIYELAPNDTSPIPEPGTGGGPPFLGPPGGDVNGTRRPVFNRGGVVTARRNK